MYQMRYGRPRIKDCCYSLILISFLFIMGIVAIVFENKSYGLFFMTVSGLNLVYILLPYFEWYYIEHNVIHVKKKGREYQIIIPADPVLIISDADVHELFGHQSFSIHDKYAISILNTLSIQSVSDRLFGSCKTQYRYTNSTIERDFSQDYIYSFVFDQSDLELILQDAKCDIIIPKSILDASGLTNISTRIYSDDRC